MSQFEGLLKGTVGDYKEMEVSFELNANKTPYHAKPYRIPVVHMPLIKTAIKEMCKNKTLAEYISESEEERRCPNLHRLPQARRSHKKEPLVDTNNTRHDPPMWRHDIRNSTGPNLVILCDEY